ncbi:MAG: mechanosensitive ion channel [Saprospiraceae bacterium]|nr:mechanosensitive ion channel [Saprospiraceae bacterium]
MRAFLHATWFEIAGQAFSYGQVLFSMAFICVSILIYWYLTRRLLPPYFKRSEIDEKQSKTVHRILIYIFYLCLLLGLILILDLDRPLFTLSGVDIQLSILLQALLILQLARFADWLISRVFIHGFYERRDRPRKGPETRKPVTERSANRTVQWAVYILAVILILTTFQIDYVLAEYRGKDDEVDFVLRVSNIFKAILIILIARVVIWVMTQLVLYNYYKRRNIDKGSQFAFNQLLSYVVYVLAILIAITELGVNSTLIWGGLAALAVGIGLGLQQTFNDFFSGIILLFERSVEIGDVLQLQGGLVGTVSKIGIRASIINTRDNVTVVVPNSKLVTDNVINWSHFDDKVRFKIDVSVAYGTDTSKVKEALLRVTKDNPHIIDFPAPFVRLIQFADSGIIFELHFWSREMIFIEDIKSELRLKIDREFHNQGIVIPFPQRDVWFRNMPSPAPGN